MTRKELEALFDAKQLEAIDAYIATLTTPVGYAWLDAAAGGVTNDTVFVVGDRPSGTGWAPLYLAPVYDAETSEKVVRHALAGTPEADVREKSRAAIEALRKGELDAVVVEQDIDASLVLRRR